MFARPTIDRVDALLVLVATPTPVPNSEGFWDAYVFSMRVPVPAPVAVAVLAGPATVPDLPRDTDILMLLPFRRGASCITGCPPIPPELVRIIRIYTSPLLKFGPIHDLNPITQSAPTAGKNLSPNAHHIPVIRPVLYVRPRSRCTLCSRAVSGERPLSRASVRRDV
jgi:hypothetical protein